MILPDFGVGYFLFVFVPTAGRISSRFNDLATKRWSVRFAIFFMLANRFFEHEFDLVSREVLFEILHWICGELIDDPLVDRFKFFNALFVQSDIEIQLSICLIVARRIVRTEAITQMNFDRTIVWEGDPAVLVALGRRANRPEAPIVAELHFYRVVSVRSASERNGNNNLQCSFQAIPNLAFDESTCSKVSRQFLILLLTNLLAVKFPGNS